LEPQLSLLGPTIKSARVARKAQNNGILAFFAPILSDVELSGGKDVPVALCRGMRILNFRGMIGAIAAFAVWGAAAEEPATNRFGFGGPELFPIDSMISLIRCADIDGDGLKDLIVVNNLRSQINILFNQTGKTNTTPARRVQRELNDLPPDARFRIESIPSEKRISSLVVQDLNGDGRPDLAYYGEPRELVVQYNNGAGGWSAPKRFAIGDGQMVPDALVVGDMNGDGLPDLLVLGETCVYLLTQKSNHTLEEPERIPFTDAVRSLQALDIDGDGRDDLLMVSWESAAPIRFRLQTSSGQLGPEVHFLTPPIRSYTVDDLNGDHKAEIASIALNSGRAQVSDFVRKPSEILSGTFSRGQFSVYPFTRTAKAKRGIAWADVSGDGLADLLAADPESAQLLLFVQKPDGSLAAPLTFPTLTGVTDLAVCDWDGDGTPDIFLLSGDERQVGVTHFDKNGRVAFPKTLPCPGAPLTMAVGMLRAKEKPTLAVIADEDGKRVLATLSADGKRRVQKLDAKFKASPSAMIMHDVNQDGLTDLVILSPYEKIKTLLQLPGKAAFDEQDVLPPGGAADEPWAGVADVDGDGKPELLLAQRNFARAVVLQRAEKTGDGQPGWAFVVKDQINGFSSQSGIIGAAPLRNGTNAIDSIFLLDGELKCLTLCERDRAGVWQPVGNINLPVNDFYELQSVALDGGKPNSLAFLGVNAAATLRLSGDAWQFNTLDSYETPIRDGRLNDVVAGDLNNDQRKELVFLETARNYLDIVALEPPGRLVPINRWPVFEERTFRSRRNESMEPREALAADVTGDGKNDLIILAHDRVLVYPQE
jgi:hypothetical protein